LDKILSVDKSAELMTCLVERFHTQVKAHGLYSVIEHMDGPLPSLKGTALIGIFNWSSNTLLN